MHHCSAFYPIGIENDMSSISNVLARINNSLEQQNIDGNSCVQRIICSHVHDAQTNLKHDEAGTVDQVIYAVAK